MTRAWIGLGANLGQPSAQLEGALDALRGDPRVTELTASGFHRTVPVGGPRDQDDYCNAVARLEFDGSARELLDLLQVLESRAGRVREVPDGPRTLDLDLLIFGGVRTEDPDLTLPHPRLEERGFVLVPMAEIEPELLLPNSGLPVSVRARELSQGVAPWGGAMTTS
ncbi:MAG: 2-amino-4-hydroxy-6-hydroxymethyldihydropteridine diphosphokinase [Planctomycetota bacterium]|jgi:2-amino-4-hydroxy-6-hydroxymethyldihydropteridine diphosphokinase